MSIKTAILAATIAVTGSLASAGSNFQLDYNIDASSNVELGLIRSEANGVVEVYNFQGGVAGELLGTQNVHAGANRDVRINIGSKPRFDVLAVLKVGGEVVATQEFDVNR